MRSRALFMPRFTRRCNSPSVLFQLTTVSAPRKSFASSDISPRRSCRFQTIEMVLLVEIPDSQATFRVRFATGGCVSCTGFGSNITAIPRVANPATMLCSQAPTLAGERTARLNTVPMVRGSMRASRTFSTIIAQAEGTSFCAGASSKVSLTMSGGCSRHCAPVTQKRVAAMAAARRAVFISTPPRRSSRHTSSSDSARSRPACETHRIRPPSR